MDLVISYLPSLALALVSGAFLWGVHWFLIGRHPDIGHERKFPRQIIMLGLSLLSVLAMILVLPISEGSRNRLIGLIGLIISGVFAFSSTNVLANLMGGILLRITKPFRIGDFVRVGEYFGRISERGLFDTEIQTENRELVAIPNTFLITNPITTTRSSGVIVTATLSLGFDIHHSRVEPLLLKAAEESGLEEPFVHIVELGNFSVTYRVSGFLVEVKRLITARSNLYRSILDTLHGQGIEIMSPTYINQRRLSDDKKAIPEVVEIAPAEELESAEDLAFDKAERAEQIEKDKLTLLQDIQTMEAALKDTGEEDKARIKKDIELARKRLKVLEETTIQPEVVDHIAEPVAPADADEPRR